MNAFTRLLLKILALFCFCGGPLFFFDRTTQANPSSSKADPTLFVIHFLPVALALFGVMSLIDDQNPNAFDKSVVLAGALGMLILVGESLYALTALLILDDSATEATEQHTNDTGLVIVGCITTFVHLEPIFGS